MLEEKVEVCKDDQLGLIKEQVNFSHWIFKQQDRTHHACLSSESRNTGKSKNINRKQ